MTFFPGTHAIRMAIAVALLLPLDAAAQPAQRDSILSRWSDPAIATVVLVDTLAGANATAVVIRRAGDAPNNIILVTRSTSAADLSRAVTALAFSRRSKGDRVDREMRTTITASATGAKKPTGATKPTGDERRAARDLRRLTVAPDFTIRGIARGPAISIRMAAGAVVPTTTKPRGR